MLITEQIKQIKTLLFFDLPFISKTLYDKMDYTKSVNNLEKTKNIIFESNIFCFFPFVFMFIFYKFELKFESKLKFLRSQKWRIIFFTTLIILFYSLIMIFSLIYNWWFLFSYLSILVFIFVSSWFYFLLSDYYFAYKTIKEVDNVIKTSAINNFSKNFLLKNKSLFVLHRENMSLFPFSNLIDFSSKIQQQLDLSSLITIDIDSKENKIRNMHRVHDEIDSFFVFCADKSSKDYKISFLFNVTELNEIEKQKIIDSINPLVESFFCAEYFSTQGNITFNNEINLIFKSHYQEFLLNKKLNLTGENDVKKPIIKRTKI